MTYFSAMSDIEKKRKLQERVQYRKRTVQKEKYRVQNRLTNFSALSDNRGKKKIARKITVTAAESGEAEIVTV